VEETDLRPNPPRKQGLTPRHSAAQTVRILAAAAGWDSSTASRRARGRYRHRPPRPNGSARNLNDPIAARKSPPRDLERPGNAPWAVTGLKFRCSVNLFRGPQLFAAGLKEELRHEA